MKRVLIIHTKPALNDLQGKEALDLSLIFGAYEQHVTVLFYHHGVFQALAHQDPELLSQKDYLSTIKALEIYDIEEVYACRLSIEKYQLDNKELIEGVQPIGLNDIEKLKLIADHIMVI